jgi:quercetin dioxygenase-like cupin family protein
MSTGTSKTPGTGKPAGGATRYSWAEIPEEQLNPLFTRQYVSGEKSMLARIFLKQGCVVPMHSHLNEQISLVLSGSIEFELGGEKHILRESEILVIPANLPHAAVALEDFLGYDLFAPPRQDWLDQTDSYLRGK